MNPVTTIIFDFGNVLVQDRSKDPSFIALEKTLPKAVQRQSHRLVKLSELGKIPYGEVTKYDKRHFFPGKSAREIERYFFKTKVLPGWKLANRLAKRYRVIIFSNHHRGKHKVMAKFLHLDLSPFAFINSAEVGMRKPQKGFYRYLLKKFRLKPLECVFIDDRIENIGPARGLGIRSFHYRQDYPKLLQFLRSQGVRA